MIEFTEMSTKQLNELSKDLDDVLIKHGLTKHSRIEFWSVLDIGVQRIGVA